MPNFNEKTGIAFGYISASVLHPDLVTDLMGGNSVFQFEDHSWEAFKAECIATYRQEHGEKQIDPPDPETVADSSDDDIWNIISDEMSDGFEPEESEVSGIYEGVHYASSWLGGALNFFIFESPVTTDKARLASPCVPGAGILDTLDGSETSYDVPADWRHGEDD